jgi:hypothetical protein
VQVTTRHPPAAVLRQLRREVGFGCPVDGCDRPYLTWHHFDPPWRLEQHHRPESMIALCRLHADQADGGAYTVEQLRRYKSKGATEGSIRGRFEWMRNELLLVAGGGFYYQCPIVLQWRGRPQIWFERDESKLMLLNVEVPTGSGEPRAKIENNFWVVRTPAEQVICPPSGRLLDVRYPNGDRFKVEFRNIESAVALARRYPQLQGGVPPWPFPLTAVEVLAIGAHTEVQLTPKATRFRRGGFTGTVIVEQCQVAIAL